MVLSRYGMDIVYGCYFKPSSVGMGTHRIHLLHTSEKNKFLNIEIFLELSIVCSPDHWSSQFKCNLIFHQSLLRVNSAYYFESLQLPRCKVTNDSIKSRQHSRRRGEGVVMRGLHFIHQNICYFRCCWPCWGWCTLSRPWTMGWRGHRPWAGWPGRGLDATPTVRTILTIVSARDYSCRWQTC